METLSVNSLLLIVEYTGSILPILSFRCSAREILLYINQHSVSRMHEITQCVLKSTPEKKARGGGGRDTSHKSGDSLNENAGFLLDAFCLALVYKNNSSPMINQWVPGSPADVAVTTIQWRILKEFKVRFKDLFDHETYQRYMAYFTLVRRKAVFDYPAHAQFKIDNQSTPVPLIHKHLAFKDSSIQSSIHLYSSEHPPPVITDKSLRAIGALLIAALDKALPSTAGISHAAIELNFGYPRLLSTDIPAFLTSPLLLHAGFGGACQCRIERIAVSTPSLSLSLSRLKKNYKYNLIVLLPDGGEKLVATAFEATGSAFKIYCGEELLVKMVGSFTGSAFRCFTVASTATAKEEMSERAYVEYGTNFLGNCPREMTVVVPRVPLDAFDVPYTDYSDVDLSISTSVSIAATVTMTTPPSTPTVNPPLLLPPLPPLQNAIAAAPNTTGFSMSKLRKALSSSLLSPTSSVTPSNHTPLPLTQPERLTLETLWKAEQSNRNANANVRVLKNAEPWWSTELNAFVLNFRGRVTQASVKNFQLIEHPNQSHINNNNTNNNNNNNGAGGNDGGNDVENILLQFGRIGEDEFSMDTRAPLSVVQGFSIALTTLVKKFYC